MRKKFILPVIISLIGFSTLSVSFYYKHKLNQAKKGIDTLLSPLSANPFGDVLGSNAKSQLGSYEVKIHILMAIGAVITACGVSYLVYKMQKE